MTPLAAALAALGLIVATSALGIFLKRRNGRVHDMSVGTILHVDPQAIGIEHLGAAATIVQFSTQYCTRCPGVRNAITKLVSGRDGVKFAHVDLTHEPELAKRFKVMQTPTLLLLDDAGVPRSRLSGPVALNTVTNALNGIYKG